MAAGKGRGGGSRGPKQRVRTAKRRAPSSTRWLQRQLNDPYVIRAQKEGFRGRAAYKLIELDDRCDFLKAGKRVVDLGAAPGGWTQVAVLKVGGGRVVALDLRDMDPVPGAAVLRGDLNDEATVGRLRAALDGPADVVLSDMAAPATGHAATDHLRVVALGEVALDFALAVLAPGGCFVVKVFKGGAERDLLRRLRQSFATVKHVKPPASRKESAETYVVATGFRANGEGAPPSP